MKKWKISYFIWNDLFYILLFYRNDWFQRKQFVQILCFGVPQAKFSINRKTSSRGKKERVDPRQQIIKKFFQVEDAEEMGKLESSNRLNLEADNAGLGGGAVGVSSSESKVGPIGEWEKELSE